ncbi:hypothetical protein BsWGS_15753 [Bradybaena similaris]
MDTAWAVVAILTLFNLTPGDMSSTIVVTIKESSTKTISCSGESNETIWDVSWAVIMENGSRQLITYSYNTDEESQECNEGNVLKGISNCSVKTELDTHTFTSELTLWNVTSTCRHVIVECIMGNGPSESFIDDWEIQLYNLSVYHLSDDVKCSASQDANHAISVSCEASQVYPDIICRIFPQLQRNFSQLESKSHLTMLSELSNVTQVKKRLERSVDYYEVSCRSNYYPTEAGRYQFRVIMYPINDPFNPIANMTTNSLEVNGKEVYYKKHQENQIYYKKHQENQETTNDLSAINQAFYTLIGSILILGVSVFLIVSWIVWTKRGRCFPPPSTTTESNEYATINDTGDVLENQSPAPVSLPDEGYGESAGGDVVSDAEADEDTLPQKLLEERGYVPNVTVPKAHIRVTTGNVYIDPITPTSTLSRSLEERHDRGSSISDDNYHETHSKMCL